MSWLDADGYPTSEALTKITDWPWSEAQAWFEFIHDIWWMPDWGWRSEPSQTHSGKPCIQYNLSTGGWSGNESIIYAMQKNYILWTTTWLQSRRGGHYSFELVNEQ